MQKIVFVGNCQADVVRSAYDRFVGVTTGDKTQFVPTFREPTPQQRKLVAEADIVVEMLLDAETTSGLENIEASGKKIRFPLVSGGWLWPNHSVPHPHVARFRYHAGAMSNCSDAFLNKAAKDGVDPADAAERYAAQTGRDFRALDRRYEIMMEKQRARDAATGFSTADFIDRHFRDERVFTTIFHPTPRLAKYIVMETFARLDVDADGMRRTEKFMQASFFPKTEVPIHPAVAEHFRLTYVAADQTWPWLNTGFISFKDYAARYVAWDVNETLEDGMKQLDQGDAAGALPLLREGLRSSPDSVKGLTALMRAHTGIGEPAEAVAAGRAAPPYAAEDANFQAVLAIASSLAGDHASAVHHFAHARRLDPSHLTPFVEASVALEQLGRIGEAIAVLREALELVPAEARVESRLQRLWDSATGKS